MESEGIKAQTIKTYLGKFPVIPTNALARKITKERPLLFKNQETARTAIRYHRGAKGKVARKMLSTNEFVRKNGDELRANPFGLPESASDDWKIIDFPVKSGRGLIMADQHIPYHDIEAITLGIKWGKNKGYTDFVLLDGDVNDFYELSRFEKDPHRRRFKEELDDTAQFLDVLDKQFPRAKIIFKKGNHDYRFQRFLRAKAPELFDMADFIWETYLNINQRGIIVVNHDVPMRTGKLNIIHGPELGVVSTAVNAARGAYLKARECVFLAHSHRTSQHAESTLSRRLDTAWSVGCTCCLWPEFSRLNSWNHGCAGLQTDGKDFEINNVRIFQGIVR